MSNQAPTLKFLGAMTRVVVIVMVAAAFVIKSSIHDIHPDSIGGGIAMLMALTFFSMMSPGFWIDLLEPICLLTALWAASNVFIRLSKGQAFTTALTKGVREISLNMIGAGICKMLITPFLLNLSDKTIPLKLDVTIESLSLALIGVLLILIAQQGRRLQTELEQFV